MLFTVDELSKYLHLHPKSVYKKVKENEIPFIKQKGVGLRFKKSVIDKWLEEGSYYPAQNVEIQSQIKLDSLVGYDKRFLEVKSVSDKMTRWRYSNGIVYRIKNQGSESWGIEYRDENGKRKQRIVPNAQSRRDAVIALNHRVQEVFNVLHGVKSEKKEIKFNEFAEMYLKDYAMVAKESGKTDESRLKRIKEYFKSINDLREITPLTIQKFRAQRLKEGVSKVTTNREIALLKRMFNIAIEESYLEENPTKRIKMYSELNTVRDRVLSEEEEPRLFSELAEHARPFVFSALHTGMRHGELQKLKWCNVDFGKRKIKVEETKSKRVRFIWLNSMMFDVLVKLKVVNGKGQRVFPFKGVRKTFEGACRRAGIEDLTFHDLRRTFGTRLLEAGVDIVTISKLYGHSSVLVTQRYLHPKDSLSKEAVELLVKKEEKVLEICEMKKEKQSKGFAIHSFSVN